MSGYMTRCVCALTTIFALSLATEAPAQFFPGTGACYCLRPVTQTYYRTMPVTEYRQVQQTVRRPIIETKYVDQAVTEYRQVVETKTVDMPTVSYQTTTSYQSTQQPYGQWVTRYYYSPKMAPYQYDNRPDLLGLINRTAFALRQAFTPTVVASREFVTGNVAQTIPVTQTVAVPGTRKVSYNVTRMVPQTSTRKVAVNSIRYVNETVTALRPVTVMRNIPIGTRTTYSYSPYTIGGSQMVLLPSPTTTSSPARAAAPQTPANARKSPFDAGEAETPRSATGTSNSRSTTLRSATPAKRVPSVVRVSGWRARRSPHISSSGPELIVPGVQVASDR